MRLHLPTLLLAALLACMACAPSVAAASYTAEGVDVTGFTYNSTESDYVANFASTTDRFYDGGKGSKLWVTRGDMDTGDQYPDRAYQIYVNNNNDLSVFGDLASDISVSGSSLNFSALNSNDSGHCWAYTTSNMFQYWQSYYGVFAKKVGDTTTSAPIHGYSYGKEHVATLGGAQSLKLNKFFYDNCIDTGGSATETIGWYMDGVTQIEGSEPSGTLSSLKTNAKGGYFSQYFDSAESACNYTDYFFNDRAGNLTLAEASASIKSHFGVTQTNDDIQRATKGQILYLELRNSQAQSHAITCYGFETDDNGNITALYVANSDDKGYRLVKVYCDATNRGLELYTSPEHYAWTSWNDWRVTGWASINTTADLKNMLNEYESNNLIWMGNLSEWRNATMAKGDHNELPTDATGWMTYAGANTKHAGYYNAYYTTGRGVEFNDAADSSNVTLGEDITAPSMTVDNTEKAYIFSGGDTKKTITVEDFTKKGSGAVSFSGVKLVTDTATLEGDVTFDELHVKESLTVNAKTIKANTLTLDCDATFDELHITGTLNASGKTINAKSIRLDGNATIGNIGSTTNDPMPANGTTALMITGGTTTLENGWVNLKSLEISDSARLVSHSSICVAGDLTTSTIRTGTLPDGILPGIKTTYCLQVEGSATLSGDIDAGAYIQIGSNATVNAAGSSEGNVNARENISIKGNANIAGDLITKGKNASEFNADWIKDSCIHIGGNADVGGNVSATAHHTGKKADITITGYADVAGSLTAHGDVTINGSRADIDGTVDVGGNLSVKNGKLTLLNGGSVNGKVAAGSLTLAAGKTLTTKGDLEVAGALASGTAGSQATITAAGSALLGGNVSNIKLEAQNITLSPMGGTATLTNAQLTVAADGLLTLENVVVDSSSLLSGGVGATLAVSDVTFLLGTGNVLLTQTTLARTAQVMTLTNPGPHVELSCSALEGLTITGSGITFDLSGLSDADKLLLDSAGSVSLTFSEGVDFSAVDAITLTLNGEQYAQALKEAGSTSTFTFSQQPSSGGDGALSIPEPTTATLSLLALAALAARRRRK